MMYGSRYTDHRSEEMQDVEDYNSDYYENQPGDIISNATRHRRTRKNKAYALALLSVGTVLIVGGIGFALYGKEEEHMSKQQPQNFDDSFPTRAPTFVASPTKSPVQEPQVTLENPTITSEGEADLSTPTPSAAPVSTAPTHSSLYDFISSLVGDVALQDPDTLAFRALDFLKQTHDESRFSNTRLQQRFALACLHLATTSEESNWVNQDGWMTDIDECTWYGVDCKQHKVVALNFTSNGLQGLIPWEITLLKEHLVSLELANNDLANEGHELAWIGELTNLRMLDVERTNFSYDGIPPYISQLSDLQILDVSETLFIGDLDGSVFEPLTQLIYLEMGGNLYNTSMPLEIATLPNLEALYAYNTGMYGSVDFLSSLNNIVELWLDDNPMLGGTIPTEIGLLTHMASLSMTNGDLWGQLPTEIGKLTMMEQMWFYGNWFSGTIPSEYANLPMLQILGLEDNNITDVSMPSEFCAKDMLALTADCGSEYNFVKCDCCTCCKAPCPIVNLPSYDSGRLLKVQEGIQRHWVPYL